MRVLAWALFALGVAHLGYGVVRFRAPLAEAWQRRASTRKRRT